MIRYTYFILVIAYSLLSNCALLMTLRAFHWNIIPGPPGVQLYCMICWLFFCLSAVYWWPDIKLTKMNVRQCILEEEQLLLSCLEELREKSGDQAHYKIFILEEEGPNAFAIGNRTIVMSRGLMTLLTPSELSAVMAHEMGHLRSHDPMAGAAFTIAVFLTFRISRLIRALLQPLKRMCMPRRYFVSYNPLAEYGGAAAILILFIIFSVFHLFHYLLAMICILGLLTLIDKIFIYLWLWNARLVEYEQDAFAHQLGYGQDLKDALLKITNSIPPQPVNLFAVLTYQNHPIVYNRIRRLEKLAGLR